MNKYIENQDITYGIDNTIRQALEKAFEKNNKETFKVLDRFIKKVVLLSVKNDSLNHFSKYITVYSSYYFTTYARAKENAQYKNIHREVSEAASIHLKEILKYFLIYSEDDVSNLNFQKLEKHNQFIYLAFNSFSTLLYSMVNNGDNNFFDYAINQYNQLDILSRNNFDDLGNQLKYYPEKIENLENQKKLYSIVSQYQSYKKHLIIGIKYWTYLLYNVKRNNLETTLRFVDKLNFYSDSNDFLRDIIFLRNQGYKDYFNWDWWDFMERYDMDFHQPPSSRDWLTLGFLIDLIREGRFYFNPDEFKGKELEQISFLAESIKDLGKMLTSNYSKWKQFLKVTSQSDLDSKLNRITAIFEQFTVKNITEKKIAIADAPLSGSKIIEFQNQTGKRWEHNSLARNLFVKFENRKITSIDKVKVIGYRKQQLGQAKAMFIEGDNSIDSYYLNDYGRTISNEIDDYFFNILFSYSYQSFKKGTILQCIDLSISALDQEGYNADIIVIPSEYSYKDGEFLNHPNFIMARNEEKDSLTDNFLIGKYNDIPVYISNSDLLRNRLIVCDFSTAFNMKYAEDPGWYKNELQIEVSLIDVDRAREIYARNPSDWRNRNGLEELSETDALINLRTGIEITIASYCKFEITNSESFVLGYISENEDQV